MFSRNNRRETYWHKKKLFKKEEIYGWHEKILGWNAQTDCD